MTATIYTEVTIDATTDSLVSFEGIEEFLRDPIGYGDYDYSDQIGLDEFCLGSHFREPFLSPLT